ncbi:MAG: lipoprotein signal peptidase [Betaproteobacteria bacterium]|nr:lipoprotein signal peptidase [Betaproteobacteria bacterium]
MPESALRGSWPWFAAAAAVLMFDQVTKALVMACLRHGETLVVAPFFNLVLVTNKGAAFSLFASASGWQTPFFVTVAVVAVGVVGWMIVREQGKYLLCAGLALILGGALGNLWDRLTLGQVVDFLDFHAWGRHWPAFNVADSAITVGAAILILESFMHRDEKSA